MLHNSRRPTPFEKRKKRFEKKRKRSGHSHRLSPPEAFIFLLRHSRCWMGTRCCTRLSDLIDQKCDARGLCTHLKSPSRRASVGGWEEKPVATWPASGWGSCGSPGPQGLTTEDTKDHGDARRRWAKAGGSAIRRCGQQVRRLRRQAARCPPLPGSARLF